MVCQFRKEFFVIVNFLDEESLEVQQLPYWGHTKKSWEPLVCSITRVMWIFSVLKKDKELKLFHVNRSR